METQNKPGILFRFRRPSNTPKQRPSKAITEALRHLAESEEMRSFVAEVRARRRNEVLEVYTPAAIGTPKRHSRSLVMPEEGPMEYFYEEWLLELIRRDFVFLRRMRIKPCLLDDPCPEPLPEEFIRLCKMTHARAKDRLTKKDAQWLRECGVAWEPEPAFQLPLGFRRPPLAAPGRQ
jgi:hypothetical protein